MSTPILTELAAPVLLMAEAFVGHQVSVGQSTKADENVAALVAFKRALKEVDVPAPTLTVPPTEMPANDMARLEHRTRMRGELLNGLARAINETSTENASNTPDFILANFAAACLDAFAEASLAREAWYGKSLSIGGEAQPAATAQDALIAEALSERTKKMISHLRFQKEKNPNSVTWEGECVLEITDALTAEWAARVAAERELKAQQSIFASVNDCLKITEECAVRAKQGQQFRGLRLSSGARPLSHVEGLATRFADCALSEIELIDERDALRTQLAEAREQLALCASNTTAADLAQEVEFLKAERDGIIAALGYGGDEDAWPSGHTIAEAIVAMRRESGRFASAIRWALGQEDDFPDRKDGQGAYWWRTELRMRAGVLPEKEANDATQG